MNNPDTRSYQNYLKTSEMLSKEISGLSYQKLKIEQTVL